MLVGLSNAITLASDPVKFLIGIIFLAFIAWAFIYTIFIGPKKRKKQFDDLVESLRKDVASRKRNASSDVSA